MAAAVPRLDLDDPLDELAAPPLLPWLLALESVVEQADPTLQERRALRVVDALIQRPEAPLELIPRARTVIPHLLALLRRPDCALPALAEQVGRDLVLTAEVMRAARSAALVRPVAAA
ncbi:HDOD domain-containing protein, partial [Methylibium sp. T29]|uniref:HDOD domain-containing protein n=1 Tax=Methylibium sp. T29 TaxID=1430884 RepID=UPI000566A247